MHLARFNLCALAVAMVYTLSVATQTKPPVAVVRDVVDTYFGVQVHDPYRYLEDLKNPEVQTWLKGQADFTRSTLDRIPGRQTILSRIEQLGDAATARIGTVLINNDHVYFLKRLASENLPKLYVRDGFKGKDQLLVDPESMKAPEGKHNSINYFLPSLDNRFLAYGISSGGSEDAVLHVLEIATGEETGDVIDRAQFGATGWTQDNRLFYTRLQKLAPGSPAAEKYLNARAYLHTLGTDPEKDIAVLGSGVSTGVNITPAAYAFAGTAPGSPWAFGVVLNGVQKELTVYLAPIASLCGGSPAWRKVIDPAEGVTRFSVIGNDLYLMTHQDASRYKILKLSLANPEIRNAREVIPAGEGVITEMAAALDALYVSRMNGATSELLRLPYAQGSPVETVKLPFAGNVSNLVTDVRVPGVAYFASAWTRFGGFFTFDPKTKRVFDAELQPQGQFDNPQDLVAEEVKVKASDGVLIPLSIVYKKGLKRNGNNPLLLNGYGSYGIPQTPTFGPSGLVWYEQGGVYAVAHVRGGGEFGEDWHKAGQKLNKSNTWRDAIACAEWLIARKYTSASKLAIQGGSAGGIFVGRAITERPDLFAAAIDAAPLSDMVRAELSASGVPNIPEFGSVKTEDGFKGLFAMSAYHQVENGVRYPAVLVTTGINDPRVEPWHAAKMAARLQAATASGKPISLRIDYDAGHGFGSTKKQGYEQITDMISFLLWQLGVKGFQP